MRLESWCFVPGWNAIGGRIFDHPNFNNGEQVTTSDVVSFNKEKMELKTNTGSIYSLGVPNADLQNQIDYIERYLNERSGVV